METTQERGTHIHTCCFTKFVRAHICVLACCVCVCVDMFFCMRLQAFTRFVLFCAGRGLPLFETFFGWTQTYSEVVFAPRDPSETAKNIKHGNWTCSKHLKTVLSVCQNDKTHKASRVIVCASRIPPRQLAADARRPGGSDALRLRSSEALICWS